MIAPIRLEHRSTSKKKYEKPEKEAKTTKNIKLVATPIKSSRSKRAPLNNKGICLLYIYSESNIFNKLSLSKMKVWEIAWFQNILINTVLHALSFNPKIDLKSKIQANSKNSRNQREPMMKEVLTNHFDFRKTLSLTYHVRKCYKSSKHESMTPMKSNWFMFVGLLPLSRKTNHRKSKHPLIKLMFSNIEKVGRKLLISSKFSSK